MRWSALIIVSAFQRHPSLLSDLLPSFLNTAAIPQPLHPSSNDHTMSSPWASVTRTARQAAKRSFSHRRGLHASSLAQSHENPLVGEHGSSSPNSSVADHPRVYLGVRLTLLQPFHAVAVHPRSHVYAGSNRSWSLRLVKAAWGRAP